MNERPVAFRVGAVASILVLVGCQELPPLVAPPEDPLASVQAPAAQELRAMFARAAPEVLALPGTVFADHHEASNRLVFGVERGEVAFGVQNALQRLGIPGSAYRIQVVEPIHFMSTTLRTEHRPTMGGLQIHWDAYVCTLGLNVDHTGGRSFITNSHCTVEQGTTGKTQYNQPSRSASTDPIAFEAHDPEYFTGNPCPANRRCRYSDAARALYEDEAGSTRGGIARTTGVNNGSITVDGSFRVTEQNDAATTFSGTLHKVGRTTGWSSGNVTNTCVSVNVSGTDITLLCQTLVQRRGRQIVGGGDSGSPVFRPTSGDDVQLVGILWGGSTRGDLFVFSPLKNVQDELGPVTATATADSDPPPDNGDDENGDDGNGGGGGGGNCPPGNPNHRNCS